MKTCGLRRPEKGKGRTRVQPDAARPQLDRKTFRIAHFATLQQVGAIDNQHHGLQRKKRQFLFHSMSEFEVAHTRTVAVHDARARRLLATPDRSTSSSFLPANVQRGQRRQARHLGVARLESAVVERDPLGRHRSSHCSRRFTKSVSIFD